MSNNHRNDDDDDESDYIITESTIKSSRRTKTGISGQEWYSLLKNIIYWLIKIGIRVCCFLFIALVAILIYWMNAPFFANCVPLSNQLTKDLVLPRFQGKRFNTTDSSLKCRTAIHASFYSTIGGMTLPTVNCSENPLSQSCSDHIAEYCSATHANTSICGPVDRTILTVNRTESIKYIGECSWSTDNAFGTHNTYQIGGSVLRLLTEMGADIPGKNDFYETHPPIEVLLAAGNRAFELDIHNCGDNNICTFHAPFEENVYHKCTETYFDILSEHLEANPTALILYVWLDTKTMFGRPTCKGTVNTMQLVQNTILRSINLSRILTPYEIFPPQCDRFLNITFDSPHHLLLECAERYGLPTIDSVRGRIAFIASFDDSGSDCYAQFQQIPFTQNIMFLRKADLNSLFQQVEFDAAVNSLESLVDVQSNEMLRLNLASYQNLTQSLVANLIQSHDHMAYNLYTNASLIDMLGNKYSGFKDLGLIGPSVFKAFDHRRYKQLDCLVAAECGATDNECVEEAIDFCATL